MSLPEFLIRGPIVLKSSLDRSTFTEFICLYSLIILSSFLLNVFTCHIFHQYKGTKSRIKDELRFKYVKKQKLKKFQYNIHLELATFLVNMWHVIENDINDKSELEMQNKYKTLDNKLKKLRKTSNNKCM
jgi:hypothetical protein